MKVWQRPAVWGSLGGAFVGTVDAVRVAATGRLGLGAPGVAALLGAGLIVGLVLGLLFALIAAVVPRVRAAAPEAHALVGAVGVLAARLGAGEAVSPSLGVARSGLLVAAAVLVVGLALVALVGRFRSGARVTALVGAIGALVGATATGRATPVGQPSGPERPDLVLVTIDGARADRYGANPIDTPGFDRVAAEGARLEVVLSPGGDAGRGLADLLHGRPPVPAAPTTTEPSTAPAERDDAGPVSLAAALTEQGYATGAFLAAPVDPALVADFHVVDGDTGWPLGLGRALPGLLLRAADLWRLPPERRAHEVVDRAVRFVRSRPGAYFAWVHLQDPLPPYDPPAPWDERYAPAGDAAVGGPPVQPRLSPEHGDAYAGVADPRVVEARYDGEVASADAQVARLLASVDEAGRPNATLVVVTGLQGQQLAEGDVWFGRGDGFGEGVLHVTSALRLPGRIPAGEVIRAPVELGDVGATLFDLLGVGDEADGAVSLKATIEGTGVARRFARAATPDESAVRLPGVLLTWSRTKGYRAVRLDRDADDARAWTEDRVREELARLPGPPPPPSDAEVQDVLRALQTRPSSPFEASFAP